MQYVDDPIVAAASPAAASVEGGSLITLTGAPGASSFRVDDSRGAWCHFGQVASVGKIVSSSVVVCEAPSVDKEDTVSLGAAIDALKSVRLFNYYAFLQSPGGGGEPAVEAAKRRLLETPPEPSFAKKNPSWEGCCMGNRKTCTCGAPFFG